MQTRMILEDANYADGEGEKVDEGTGAERVEKRSSNVSLASLHLNNIKTIS